MALMEANWQPSSSQLRQFALLAALALPLGGWWWSASASLIGWLAVGGTVLAVCSWIRPQAMRPLFVMLTIITIPLGIVLGELSMLAIYGLIIWPLGIYFRLRRRDALQLRWQPQADSYWQPKARPNSVAKYYRQS